MMKTIRTVVIYLLAISIIPLGVGVYIYSLENNQDVVAIKQSSDNEFEYFPKYEDKSPIIKVRNLLIKEKFEELNQYFSKLDNDLLSDISKESLVSTSYSTFYIEDPKYEKLFNLWVKKTPNKYSAYLSRGIYYFSMAWRERGTNWASETTQEQFDGMYRYIKKANEDLIKALELNQTAIYAYKTLIDISKAISDKETAKFLELKALEIHEESFLIRKSYIHLLTPRWGGSFSEMTDYLRSVDTEPDGNPELKYLFGYVELEKAKELHYMNSYNLAFEHLKKSLLLGGENSKVYFQLGKNKIRQKDMKSGVKFLSQAIKNYSHDSEYYYWRAMAYMNLSEYEKAKDDILFANALDPFDSFIINKKNQLANLLKDEAWQLKMNSEFKKAHKFYRIALEISPYNSYLYNSMARTYIGEHKLELALESIKNAITLNPNEIDHYIILDYLLAKKKKWDEIIFYWDKYIELNPEDGRAYLERGGAYYHSGDMNKAVENAKKSADLGYLEGKEAYAKFKHLAK